MAIEKLTDAQCRKNLPRDKTSLMLSDGGNLYLQVTRGRDGDHRRSWIFRYQLPGGKSRDAGLGPYHDVPLAQAREKARAWRDLIRQGIDPIGQRNSEIAANLAKSATVMTFQEAALAYIKAQEHEWKNAEQSQQWEQTLTDYAFPIIGKLNVADIDVPHVQKVLTPIWTTITSTASSLRGRIEAVLDWAKVSGYRKGENPARWQGNLEHLFSAPSKVKPTKHHPALPHGEGAAFVTALREHAGRTAIPPLALEFLLLTAVRSHDVERAKVTDIDRAARVWTIRDVSKTKKGLPREVRVPLSKAAMAVLEKTDALRGDSDLLFPSKHGGRLNKITLSMLLTSMGLKGRMTAHGCRSMFKTWGSEVSHFPTEVIEMCMLHVISDAVLAAYQRGDLLAKRTACMEAWASYLDRPAAANVIPMAKVKA